MREPSSIISKLNICCWVSGIDIPDVPPGEEYEEAPEPTLSPEPTASPGPTESPEPTGRSEPTSSPEPTQCL